MDYVSAKEIADKWDVTIRQVQKLCSDGRIEGVKRMGRMWLIPENSEKPKDLRRKNKAQ